MMDNNDKHLVSDEIEDHKTELNGWLEEIKTLAIPTNSQGVIDRFVRDCETLLTDLNKDMTPSCADLCDFDDSRRSLEVRFNSITQDHSE